DQAVADGVDVISYSISGTSTNFVELVQVAFLNAANAGIFVAAAAGNAGPTASTVNHPGPWLTTVAAGTHNRNGEGSLTLGNGAPPFVGGSAAVSAVSGAVIDAETAGLPGADPKLVRLCFAAVDNLVDNPATPANDPVPTPVLDPAKIAGKIVLCDRGSAAVDGVANARVNKSLAVQQAGGIGTILVNIPLAPPSAPLSVNADVHFIPSIHLSDSARPALKAYAATPSPTATISAGHLVFNIAAPFTAGFSSRGPLNAGGGDVLKPDIMAPGVDVIASVAPPANLGQSFASFQGTSMATPHIAGIAALFKSRHPDWSPMMIKSALMTTASNVLDTNPNGTPIPDATRIFRQGAGHVKPNAAVDPGLVFDSNLNDWLAFLCGATTAVTPATCTSLEAQGYSRDRSDMNTASIAIGDLLTTSQTVTRRVTNVGQGSATYTPNVTGMTGFTTTVIPVSLTLAPGETKPFTVTFSRTTAAFAAFTGGQLTWSDGPHNVRVPMVVRPLALVAPAEVSGNGAPINYNVTFGYTGAFTAAGRGLVPAETTAGSVADDPDDTFSLTDTVGVTKIRDVVIPAGTTFARFSLFDTHVSPPSDIDLFVFRVNANGTRTLVVSTGGATSNENASLPLPIQAGTYEIYAHGFNVPGGATADFTLFTWVLGSASAGNMVVSAPTTATAGTTATIGLTFSGLAPATKYLGSVAYSGTQGTPPTAVTGMPNPTIVRVDTPNP
ncbi:MAG: S8 family serine peptidase, partial [Acidobacteriales bacterium]|nr:S8 family serine peptidase [Terriglobales bacterium]